MKFVGVVYSGEDQAKAVSDSRDLITAHPNLKGILGQCTTSGPGAAQAVTELKKIGKVFVTGVALPSGMAGREVTARSGQTGKVLRRGRLGGGNLKRGAD